MKTLLLFVFLFFTVMLSQSQWAYTDLTESKFRMGVTSLGTKAYFAGGESSNGQVSAIEIYDVAIDDWDTVINLLFPRSHIACVASGTQVFFAGGIDFGTFTFFDIIEIWNTATGQWTFEQLSVPRTSISAVSYGNKVLFAGGINFILGQAFDLVEIYNTDTEEWSYDILSLPRSSMGAAIVGDLAFFAGGADMQQNMTNRVDIYNFTTNTWSIDSLSQARTFLTATAVGSKVLFAGGTTTDNESSDRVDIYDTETGIWETTSLSQPRAFWEGNSGTVCDQKAFFVGGGIFDLNSNQYGDPFNTIDIYNLADDIWTTDTTYTPILAHSVIGVEDHLLIAGGMTDVDVSSRVQIYTCLWNAVEPGKEVVSSQFAVRSYPNPTGGIADFRFQIADFGRVSLKVYNAQGQEVAVVLDQELPAGEHTVQWNAEGLPAGIYYYRLTTNDLRPTTKDQRPTTTSGKIVKY